jgi:hypothetical protein
VTRRTHVLTEVKHSPIEHRIDRLTVGRPPRRLGASGARRPPVNRLLVGVWTAGLVFSLAAWAAVVLLVVALVR